MVNHLLLPSVDLKSGFSHLAFDRYLREWYEQAITNADNGLVAASICLQAVLIDIILEGRIRHDWISIMEELLTDGERPVAYSKGYSQQLYKFEAQYLQSTIHSIHTRWWIEKLLNKEKVNHEKYAKLILDKKSSDGLIYDSDVSNTILRHRMKTELSMSAAMSVEILFEAGKLTDPLRDELSTSLCDPPKITPLISITSEQFRLAALKILSCEEQLPAGIGKLIDSCAEGLQYGWNDFPVVSKVDTYMGTAKRTAYDKPIHSPLIACHVVSLADTLEKHDNRSAIIDRLNAYAIKLAKNPLDIPAFQMRDIQIPFGADLTPIEAICASWLIDSIMRNNDDRR
jgi:hypothetical protein